MDTQNIIMLAPEALVATKNIRFGLKKYRVEALAESIKEFGRVHTPLTVEPIDGTGTYSIRAGHYRQAAVLKLNKEGAGLQLPCVIEEPTGDQDRLRYQISENLDRENLSPMDMAIAIKDLLDTGMQKVEIREMFMRPGRDLKMQPLSNAMLNIYLSCLEFPKAIQTKIHNGHFSVSDAYKLSTKPKELWQEILDRAEADRIALADAEDNQETKFLATEHKQAEAEAKAKADAEAYASAQKIAADADAQAKERRAAVLEAFKAANAIPAKNKDAKKTAEDALKAKEAEAKAAEKAATDTAAAAEKAAKKVEANNTTAADRKKKLEEARAASAATPPKGKLDIDKAAAKVTGTGTVALTAPEMRKVISDFCLPGSFPKVAEIAKAIQRCFSGVTTDDQCLSELGYLTGERKERPKTLPKPEVKQ